MTSKPLLVISLFALLVLGYFYRSLVFAQIPMPGDHALGTYYPWLDYKWPGFPAGVPVKNPLLADVPSLFYPLKIYSTTLLKSGIFPTWNPLIFGGYPLLATFQSGVLNPFNLFFLIFSPTTAWTLFIAFQPLLALIFSYFFLRDLKLNPLPAIFGSIVFAFCGFNQIWLEYGIHGYVAAYIPLLFMLTRRLVIKLNPKFGFYLAVVLAGQLFSGYPQLTLFSLAFLFIWLFFLTSKIRTIIPPLIFLLLGLFLAAILLLPGAELFINSQRPEEPLAGGPSGAHLNYPELVTLIAPDYFGHPSTYNSWGGFLYTNNTGYASLVALIIAVFGLRRLSQKTSRFFILLYLVPIFLSLPHPLTRTIQTLPLFSASVATRVMVFSGFALSYLSAVGLQQIISLRLRLKDSIFPLLVVILVTLLFVKAPNPVASRNLILPIGLSLGVLTSLFLGRFSKVALLLLLVFELFRFGWKYNVFFPAKLIYPSTPLLDYLKASTPGFRLDGGDVLPLSLWMAYGLKSASGYDAVYPSLWAKYLSAIDNANLDHAKGRFGDILSYTSPLLDLSGVKYLLALKRATSGKPDPAGVAYPKFTASRFVPDKSFATVQVFTNPHALPQFSLKTGYEVISDEPNTLTRLLASDFDYQNSLLLTSSPPNFSSALPTNSHLQVLKNSSTYQALKVSSGSPVFLLNSQVFYPGWRVAIDGYPKPLLKADLAFQAVQIPSGAHLVEFTYRPLSLTIGVCVSLITLIVLVFICRRFTPARPPRLV
jgi:hypothetical protein